MVWIYNYALQRWYKHDVEANAIGLWLASTDVTFGQAQGTFAEQQTRFGDSVFKSASPMLVIGTIAGQVLAVDPAISSDGDNLPIEEIFDAPLVSIPNEISSNDLRRWLGVCVDARGVSISCYYKVEEDANWTLAGTATLGKDWKEYTFDIDVSGESLWLRFYSCASGQWFDLRAYDVLYLKDRREG
jgi:hypothetical protein